MRSSAMNLHLSVEVSTGIRWSLEKDGGKLISIPGETKKSTKNMPLQKGKYFKLSFESNP